MVTTNICLAKHVDGRPVVEADIKVDLLVDFPSGMGGTFTHKCVSVDNEKAVFESIHKDWPVGFVMEFNQPDFTREDFNLLGQALIAYSKWDGIPTPEQRSLVARAHELGYAQRMSYTQASWSDKGAEAFVKANQQPADADKAGA